jgi:hypothetical protein
MYPPNSADAVAEIRGSNTPGKQPVDYIERGVFYKQQISRDNVMTFLHQKYGQEIYEDKRA